VLGHRTAQHLIPWLHVRNPDLVQMLGKGTCFLKAQEVQICSPSQAQALDKGSKSMASN